MIQLPDIGEPRGAPGRPRPGGLGDCWCNEIVFGGVVESKKENYIRNMANNYLNSLILIFFVIITNTKHRKNTRYFHQITYIAHFQSNKYYFLLINQSIKNSKFRYQHYCFF